MGTYIPNTKAQQEEMLHDAGYSSFAQLFADVPQQVKLTHPLNLEKGKSELETAAEVKKLAGKNKVFPVILRGAGAYRHYIPSIVTKIVNKEEFVTAYTPYQAEISQGILQSIFEYQTQICELTGMDAANASHYDGATAAAEACHMCVERKRQIIFVSETVDPKILSVVKTYSFGRDAQVSVVPAKDGVTDPETLQALLSDESACLLVQQPNFYGVLEDISRLVDIVHAAGAKLVMSCNPISLGLCRTPGEYGADVAVGEGQPLGMPMGFGGPYLGFMATTKKMMRQMPGRIVGQTVDSRGQRSFVLTLQAREQHIRREKASSNICSNEALCALTASCYLSAVGPDGLAQVAALCYNKAHYLQKVLEQSGLRLKYGQPFFHEFVTEGKDAGKILAALEKEGILGGLPLTDTDILWCATEMNTKEDLDRAAAIVKEVQ